MTAFAAAAVRRFNWRTVFQRERGCYRFASTQSQSVPLFLELDLHNNTTASHVWRPPLLLPVDGRKTKKTVTSIQEAVDLIHSHYSSSEDNKIIGMGENDLGVSLFCANNDDLLDHTESTCELIQTVKQERHGIPFHLYTTGIVSSASISGRAISNDDWTLWKEARPTTWQVSLYASSPPDYAQATSESTAVATAAFGQASSFLLEAAERGMSVEAAVVPTQATSGREMALMLGAQHVYIRESPAPLG